MRKRRSPSAIHDQRVNEIVHERRGFSAETDLHLCTYFGQAPGYWLRVQMTYDLHEALHTLGRKIKVTVYPRAAA